MASAAYADSVFINCAFTADFEELRQAIVFAVIDCGFTPRCALERVDSSEVRIDKIFRIISECQHGIHDISVTEPDPVNGLPRFNMPLELGIYLGAKRFGVGTQRTKSCLILDRERYRYQKFCSDISGQDPKDHGDDPRKLIKRIRDWLRTQRSGVRLPSGRQMAGRFDQFKSDLPSICMALDLEAEALGFNDLTTVIDEWLLSNPPR